MCEIRLLDAASPGRLEDGRYLWVSCCDQRKVEEGGSALLTRSAVVCDRASPRYLYTESKRYIGARHDEDYLQDRSVKVVCGF